MNVALAFLGGMVAGALTACLLAMGITACESEYDGKEPF